VGESVRAGSFGVSPRCTIESDLAAEGWAVTSAALAQ
jgi:hypothetical protein